MVVNVQETNLGCFVFRNAPMDAALALDTLNLRLTEVGLQKHTLSKRHINDAMRLALARIANESKHKLSDELELAKVDAGEAGVLREYIIAEVPKKSYKEEETRWAVHIQERTYVGDAGQGGPVNYTEVGYVILRNDGTLTMPDGMSSDEDITNMVDWFVNTADSSKLRYCLDGILSTVAQINIRRGVTFMAEDKKDILDKVEYVFSNLDVGDMSVARYDIAASESNKVTLKKDIEVSVGDELKKMQASIVAISEGKENVTKGQVKEWLKKVADLQEHMQLFGVLEVKMPTDLSDLEEKLAKLNSETPVKAKKRQISVCLIED